MTLGLTNGTNNYGLNPHALSSTSPLFADTASYGVDVGNAAGTSLAPINKSLGITTDETKSGIESVIDTNTNYIIKY